MILLAHRNQIWINFDFEFQQIDEKVFAKTQKFQLTNCNFILREIKSFANDLIARRNRVNDKIILLLRFTERQSRNRLKFFQWKHNVSFHRWYCRYKRDIEEKEKEKNERKRAKKKNRERKQRKKTKKKQKEKTKKENRKLRKKSRKRKKQRNVNSNLKNLRKKCERIKSFDFLSKSTFKSDKKAQVE